MYVTLTGKCLYYAVLTFMVVCINGTRETKTQEFQLYIVNVHKRAI